MVQKTHQSERRQKEAKEKGRPCFHCGYELGDEENLCVVCGIQLDSDARGAVGNSEES